MNLLLKPEKEPSVKERIWVTRILVILVIVLSLVLGAALAGVFT